MFGRFRVQGRPADDWPLNMGSRIEVKVGEKTVPGIVTGAIQEPDGSWSVEVRFRSGKGYGRLSLRAQDVHRWYG